MTKRWLRRGHPRDEPERPASWDEQIEINGMPCTLREVEHHARITAGSPDPVHQGMGLVQLYLIERLLAAEQAAAEVRGE